MEREGFADNHSVLGQLGEELDAETRFMSGNFESLEVFRRIVELGEAAIPELVADAENLHWARMQAVWTIAHNLGKSIEFPEEIRGRYLPVREHTLNWARLQGYLVADAEV